MEWLRESLPNYFLFWISGKIHSRKFSDNTAKNILFFYYLFIAL